MGYRTLVRYALWGRLAPEGGITLVNLFALRTSPDQPLTAALLALLEHADRALLRGLLEQASMDGDLGGEIRFRFPLPDGPAGVAELGSSQRRIWLAAVEPGGEPPAMEAAGVEPLVISMAAPGNHGLPEAHWLSWERLDRWLEQMADRYDGETRTGFLLRQFRAYLPEAGITYFTGFSAEHLTGAPDALRALIGFYRTADELFDRLGGGPGNRFTQLRRSRPEDLLAGFCFRDYASLHLGSEDFLRIALHLESARLQVACWLGPGGAAHHRLYQLLKEVPLPLTALAAIEPEPVLWLWSTDEERQLNLRAFEPGQLAGLEWGRYTAAILVNHPFTTLAGEGLVERIHGWILALIEGLRPVLSGVVH